MEKEEDKNGVKAEGGHDKQRTLKVIAAKELKPSNEKK